MPTLKQEIQRMIDKRAPEWFSVQIVRLGKDSTEVVETGTPGVLWARMDNGKAIKVHVGGISVPSRFDLRLKIGRKKSQPGIWQVISVLENYDTPAGGGETSYHHLQHEEGGPDRVNLSRKQIMARTVRVKTAASFIVRLFGDADLTTSGYVKIPTQDIDLSSYVPSTGALFVAIESDVDGALTVHAGTGFAAPQVATVGDYPVPDAGKYTRAVVLLFEGQTSLLDEHIRVPMPPSYNPLDIPDSTNIPYTPIDVTDWDYLADPGDVADALDQLADRAKSLEITPPSGITDHGALSGLADDDHTQYIKHALSTAANDFLVGSGSNTYAKKTLAETVAILRTALDAVYADLTGWTAVSATWTRTGNHTFTVSGDVTATYRKGTKVRYKDGGAYEYGVIASSSYSAPNTTVNLLPNSSYAMAAATITDTYISYIENPEGFPKVFNFSVSWNNLTVVDGTVTAEITMDGKGVLSGHVQYIRGASDSISGAVSIAQPVACSTSYGKSEPVGFSRYKDATGGNAAQGSVNIVSGGNIVPIVYDASATYATAASITSTVPFTWATSDDMEFNFMYFT